MPLFLILSTLLIINILVKTFLDFVIETAEPTLWGKFSVSLSAGHISQAEAIMRNMNPNEKEAAETALTARKKYYAKRGITPR